MLTWGRITPGLRAYAARMLAAIIILAVGLVVVAAVPQPPRTWLAVVLAIVAVLVALFYHRVV